MRLYFIHHHEEQDKVIIFMHIDKTAGQTLAAIIDEQYPISEVHKLRKPLNVDAILNVIPKHKASKIGCYLEHLEAYLQEAPARDAGIQCIYGHIYWGAHRYLSRPYTYITLLRDPIDRVISHYYYLLGKDHFKTGTSFEDFVRHTLNRNVQTQYISGQTEPDLEAAKTNIDKFFSVVGITEMFDESLFLMTKRFGWKCTKYTKKNMTPNRPAKESFSKPMIELIQRNNQLDIELYRYARELLEKRINALDSESKEELVRWKQVCRIF